jgi:hypothetical protein
MKFIKAICLSLVIFFISNLGYGLRMPKDAELIEEDGILVLFDSLKISSKPNIHDNSTSLPYLIRYDRNLNELWQFYQSNEDIRQGSQSQDLLYDLESQTAIIALLTPRWKGEFNYISTTIVSINNKGIIQHSWVINGKINSKLHLDNNQLNFTIIQDDDPSYGSRNWNKRMVYVNLESQEVQIDPKMKIPFEFPYLPDVYTKLDSLILKVQPKNNQLETIFLNKDGIQAKASSILSLPNLGWSGIIEIYQFRNQLIYESTTSLNDESAKEALCVGCFKKNGRRRWRHAIAGTGYIKSSGCFIRGPKENLVILRHDKDIVKFIELSKRGRIKRRYSKQGNFQKFIAVIPDSQVTRLYLIGESIQVIPVEKD